MASDNYQNKTAVKKIKLEEAQTVSRSCVNQNCCANVKFCKENGIKIFQNNCQFNLKGGDNLGKSFCSLFLRFFKNTSFILSLNVFKLFKVK